MAGPKLPDRDDRHVLAAAIASEADTLVAFNQKHFPSACLQEHGVEAVHPEVFLASQVSLHPGVAGSVVRGIQERMQRPPLTVAQLLDRYRAHQLVHAADELEALLGC